MQAKDRLVEILKQAWDAETSFQFNEEHWRAVIERANDGIDEFVYDRYQELIDQEVQQHFAELAKMGKCEHGYALIDCPDRKGMDIL